MMTPSYTILASLAASLLLHLPALSQTTYNWDTLSGDWTDSSNWQGGAVPVGNSGASINLSNGTEPSPSTTFYDVTGNINQVFNGITIGSDNV